MHGAAVTDSAIAVALIVAGLIAVGRGRIVASFVLTTVGLGFALLEVRTWFLLGTGH